jgi:hypothetical protein
MLLCLTASFVRATSRTREALQPVQGNIVCRPTADGQIRRDFADHCREFETMSRTGGTDHHLRPLRMEVQNEMLVSSDGEHGDLKVGRVAETGLDASAPLGLASAARQGRATTEAADSTLLTPLWAP